MQRMEHTTKIQFCVYVLIIFLSLFLVVTNGDKPRYTPRNAVKIAECVSYTDCQGGCPACYMRCIDGQCEPFIIKFI
ncbi:late nodulin [Medicago truncatula]|uniref:Late nodulin n=1 Tax=Medicago truncatula TaxID=3880 RepID=G7JQE9_MEDTR|nr:late nodulin [Medicago truncatula]AFK35247.1 unknown [Medicago truncatula]